MKLAPTTNEKAIPTTHVTQSHIVVPKKSKRFCDRRHVHTDSKRTENHKSFAYKKCRKIPNHMLTKQKIVHPPITSG
jgi:hypothetical protein